MRMQNVLLDDIVPNPWRDMKLYPVDADHVAELRNSINDHGFFGGVKGRRRNGKVELGCGHARIAAARKAKIEGEPIESVPIFLDDMDDDAMLWLMTDENATQAGANPGAVLNEVAAVTRRLIEGLLGDGTIVPAVVKAFENKAGIDQAAVKLRKGTDVHLALGHGTIRRYLGQGRAERSPRGERQIREAITALKQSGHYDDMVDEEVRKHPQPINGKSDSKAVATTKSKPRRPRILDERCVTVFPNDHQFKAFRDAVTTPAGQKIIPVNQQHALAKQIMSDKQAGASYITKMVRAEIDEGLKAQRDLNKEEKERFLAEQRENRITSELQSANGYLRGLLSTLARMADLADEFPGHPKLGGFAARLDTLVDAIKQFSKRLK